MSEQAAQSVISELDYENLHERALIVVRIGGAEVRAFVERGPLDGSCYVRLGHGADDAAHGQFPGDFYDLGEHEFVTRDLIIREVKLRTWPQIHADKSFDVLAFAAAAFRWLEAIRFDSELASEVRYLLSEKVHKFTPEAWLGGAEGLEAERA